MLAAMDEGADLSSLRAAVSAGETLPAPVYDDWIEKTGKPMLDGIGATEMLHIFISNRFDDHRARLHRQAGDGLRGEDHRTPMVTRLPRRHGGPAGGARANGVPVSAMMRGSAIMCRTAGTSPATVSCGMTVALSPFRGAQRRHDRVQRATTSPDPRSRRRCWPTRRWRNAR